MSAQNTLIIKTRGTANGAPTADVNYAPLFAGNRNESGFLVAMWQERSSPSAIGYSDLTVQSKPAVGSNAMQKFSMKLVIPTLEVTSVNSGSGYQPAPKVAYTNELKVEATLPNRGTKEEKWELHARAVSAFSNAVILQLFKDNEQIN